MSNTPEQMLAKTKELERQMRAAKKAHVNVGLPRENIGGKAYGNGMSIMQVGAVHEFGNSKVPRRSFLRMPFLLHADKISAILAQQFALVAEGKIDTATALNRAGAAITNISKEAFVTQGFGKWQPAQKDEGQTLLDTGLLRNSITWHVAGV